LLAYGSSVGLRAYHPVTANGVMMGATS
jgi:hypothetical protein